MIVTCPSCASKYRVRDNAVPAGGAELECPSCKAMFVAYPPRRTTMETTGVGLVAPSADSGQRVRELETALANMTSAREDLLRRGQEKDAELARLSIRVAAADASVNRLTGELATAQQHAGDPKELVSLKQTLLETQRRERTAGADLEVANSLISSLKAEVQIFKGGSSTTAQVQAAQKVEQLQADVERLRAQLTQQAAAIVAPSSGPTSSVRSLISAIGPMLWGLDHSVDYLEQFAGNEATLALHVKQLRLLQKLLQRLVDEST